MASVVVGFQSIHWSMRIDISVQLNSVSLNDFTSRLFSVTVRVCEFVSAMKNDSCSEMLSLL